MTNTEKYLLKLTEQKIDVQSLLEGVRLFKNEQFYSLNRMYRNCNLKTRREISRCTGFRPFKLFTHLSLIPNGYTLTK